MIELGIDEVTLVLQLQDKTKLHSNNAFQWDSEARNIIFDFENLSNIVGILGEANYDINAPEGYTVAMTYGVHNFYFCVAFHPLQPVMGVIVKFSAQSLDYYLDKTKIKLYNFLQIINASSIYNLSCLRIDLTADYYNEIINVTTIYRDLENERIALFRQYLSKQTGELCFRKTKLVYQGIIKQNEIPTIYIGSSKSNARLRIYNKKREQIEKTGTKYQRAIDSIDWTRFECVLRHRFALQFVEALLSVEDDNEYADMIARTILQKFTFFYVENGVIEKETEYTKKLVDSIEDEYLVLRSPSSRNFDLDKSIYHLFYGSGYISVLKKIKAIFGGQAVITFLEYVADNLDHFDTSVDCLLWMKKNVSDYKKIHTDFKCYLDSVIKFIEEKRS